MMKRIVLLLFAAAAVANSQVAPLLDCVQYDQADNLLIATWGYVNAGSQQVTIMIGANNKFSPSPSLQGQPVDFQPGTFHSVFQTTFSLNAYSSQTWELNGFSATARNDPNNYCQACSCPPGPTGPEGEPGPQGPLGPAGLTGNQGVTGPAGLAGLQGPTGSLGPAGAQGMPGLQGPTGLAGPMGAIGPAGLQGPPGTPGAQGSPATLPPIRIVVADAADNAVAFCRTDEVLLGGGGTCSSTASLASSLPANSSWTVSCNAGQPRAAAVCLTNPAGVVTDVSSQVSITQTGFGRNRATGVWSATMTVTNTSGEVIEGPIQAVLAILPASVTMVNNTGTRNGNPYVIVTQNRLAPGAAAAVLIQFKNPSGGYITYTPITDSGVF